MVKTVSVKPSLRLTVQEVLSFYSEVVFIVPITVINFAFSNGKNSKHKTYSKADCARGTKLLFRSRLHSPHNSNQLAFSNGKNSKHSRDSLKPIKCWKNETLIQEMHSSFFFHSFINIKSNQNTESMK
jgi:hypothetical protein